MLKPIAVDLIAQSKEKHRHEFLRSILNGLFYDEYRFPVSGADGTIGPFTISKAQQLYLRKKQDEKWSTELHDPLGLLAAHLNFKIDIGQLSSCVCDLNVKLSLLHLTVRRRKCQLTINDDGPSGETAKESIHMNRNNTWTSRPENLKALAEALETKDNVKFSQEEIIDYLTKYEGLNQAYMVMAANELMANIEKTIHINAGGGVTVKFTLDSAWSGR
jgi:hypothetical protein